MISKKAFRRVALPAVALLGMGVGYVIGAQPHMDAALRELQAARAELQVASADKGGHRVTAIGLVDQAIGEVKAGIAVGAGM